MDPTQKLHFVDSERTINQNIKAKKDQIRLIYFPKCVTLCYQHTYSTGCLEKCQYDFKRIDKVVERAVREKMEKDLDGTMDGWYGGSD